MCSKSDVFFCEICVHDIFFLLFFFFFTCFRFNITKFRQNIYTLIADIDCWLYAYSKYVHDFVYVFFWLFAARRYYAHAVTIWKTLNCFNV